LRGVSEQRRDGVLRGDRESREDGDFREETKEDEVFGHVLGYHV
jgi:hypothetical protein